MATTSDAIARGADAIDRRAWAEARAAFEAAVAEHAGPRAQEGLATAATWLDDGDLAIAAYEQAFRGYRDEGADADAARVAVWTAVAVHDFRGQVAVARGWLARARRLTEGDTSAADTCALAIGLEGYMRLLRDSQPSQALPLIRQAATLAHAADASSVEFVLLALEGLALVTLGEVTMGMAMLDEASAAVAAGEVPDATIAATIYCFVINACERVRDVDRAGQWCDAMAAYCRQMGDDVMGQQCRTLYAGVLLSRGEWNEAERTLEDATGRLRLTRPAMAADGLVRLADLRRRQGRLEEAAALYRELEEDPFRSQGEPLATLGRAELALARGHPQEAADDAERYLRMVDPEEKARRAAGLELLARTRAATGEPAAARAAADALGTLAVPLGTASVRASASLADGAAAGAAGEMERARISLEDAVDGFEQAGAPYDAALARAMLAPVLAASGRAGRASEAERAADQAFRALGAARPPWIASVGAEVVDDPAGLSGREREILAQIASGRSNEDIATGLFLSVRTVERHVSNIYGKLGATGRHSRAIATAYAHEHHLV